MWIPPDFIMEIASACMQALQWIGRITSHLFPTWPGRF
jgi:hypothetical protein